MGVRTISSGGRVMCESDHLTAFGIYQVGTWGSTFTILCRCTHRINVSNTVRLLCCGHVIRSYVNVI